jgi:hypothetical protein
LPDAHGKTFLNEGVVDPIGVSAFENQTGVLEHAQMSGDRRGTDREPRSDLAGGALAALEILEYLTPGWVGQSSEYSGVVIHDSILAILLISINPTVETTLAWGVPERRERGTVSRVSR